jgi:hypothetical protein
MTSVAHKCPYMIGKFYLIDTGYGAKPGFLPHVRGVRYHLNEWGNNDCEGKFARWFV